jgi:hypothetical protein
MPALHHFGQAVGRWTHAQFHQLLNACVAQIPLSHASMMRIKFEGDDAPALGQRAGHPDGAVSAQSSDLKNAPRAGDPHQEFEKSSLQRVISYLSRATTKSGTHSSARLNSDSGSGESALRLCSA